MDGQEAPHTKATLRHPPAILLGRIFDRTITVMNAAGSLLILFVLVVICADVIGRVVFSRPIAGVPELVVMSIVAIVFLQFAHALERGNLVRSTLLLDVLARRAPGFRRVLELAFALVGATVFALLTFALYRQATADFRGLDQYGAPGVFLFPKWPIRAVAALGAAAVTVQFVRMATVLAWRGVR